MAKFSLKKGGREVGPASVYATPHDMSGKKISIEDTGNGEKKAKNCASEICMSVADINSHGYDPTPKTDGITIRGCGAATKGTKARGPMA